MTGRPDAPKGGELRRRAEERLRERKAREPREVDPDPRRLLHELEVHQVELEMQNEELRAAQQEVAAGLGRYTELFDFAPIGYFVITRDGTIREVNLAGARLLGMERSRLVGRRFGLFVSEAQRATFADLLGRVLSTGAENQGVESCDLGLGGEGTEQREVLFTAATLENETATALCAVQDITERRRAEAALREEGRQKDAFLAVLSHELRNPLAPIRNSLSVLARTVPGGELARRTQAVLDRQVTLLTRIVDDLLDVTRIARGMIRLRRGRVELGELARQTMDDHRSSFEAAGLGLEARFGPEVFWVDADAARLAQVLGNLLGNAVKFTSRGGTVEVFLRRDGQAVALSVRDTGMGIAPAIRQHLFEPFTAAPQALDRTRGGLGLGLAMVKGLVELHGGAVDVASAGPGQGSEFTVRLPLAASSPDGTAPAERRETRRFRVLVIEDNADSAESLRDALELGGHDVQVAHDGPSGLALARKFRPEVVLCDIGLPGMDGYEVARAFRRDEVVRGTHLVALSGYALPEDLQRATEAGFDRHVAKPPDVEKLEQLFAAALALSSGGRPS